MASAKQYLFSGSSADDSAVHKAITKKMTGKCCCDTPNVNNMTDSGRYNADGMTRPPRSEPEHAPPNSPPSNKDSSSDLVVVPQQGLLQWVGSVPYFVSVPAIVAGTGLVAGGIFNETPVLERVGLLVALGGVGMAGARMISHTQSK